MNRHSARRRSAACFLGAGLAALTLAAPAHAGNVTVEEGETAQFEITVTPKYGHSGPARIRLWYDTDGGTAVEGTDYETAHSWKHSVVGWTGNPVSIRVKTFEDDAVEGDETFNIRIRKVEVQARSRWGHIFWKTTPRNRLNFSGVKSATIKDTTPRPAHSSYEDEKYGQGCTISYHQMGSMRIRYWTCP